MISLEIRYVKYKQVHIFMTFEKFKVYRRMDTKMTFPKFLRIVATAHYTKEMINGSMVEKMTLYQTDKKFVELLSQALKFS